MCSGDHIPVTKDRRSSDSQLEKLQEQYRQLFRMLLSVLIGLVLGLISNVVVGYKMIDGINDRLLILEHEEERGSRWTAEMEQEAQARWNADKEALLRELVRIGARAEANTNSLTGISVRLDNMVDRMNRAGGH